MNTKNLPDLTVVGPSKENLEYSPQAILSLDNGLSIFYLKFVSDELNAKLNLILYSSIFNYKYNLLLLNSYLLKGIVILRSNLSASGNSKMSN